MKQSLTNKSSLTTFFFLHVVHVPVDQQDSLINLVFSTCMSCLPFCQAGFTPGFVPTVYQRTDLTAPIPLSALIG